MKYDPATAPPPDQWSELEEIEQVHLVEAYHERAGDVAEGAQLHAMLHVVVENQVAAGDETPVGDVLARLQREGLERHEALHAVAAVLSRFMYAQLYGEEPPGPDPQAAYFAEVERLTAEGWMRGDFNP